MPNIGRPSKGCILCRKRRIKCDERKPSCARCEKVNRECPGYLNPDTWLFRDESDITAKRRTRQTIAEKKDFDSPSGNTPESDESSRKRSYHKNGCDVGKAGPTGADSVSPSLVNNLEFRSVCLFMESFTTKSPVSNDDPAYLDFLPHLYVNAAEDSCLRKAISAVSQRYLLNSYGATEFEKGATRKFSEALACTNQALTDPELALADDTLATVYLLSLYELMTDLNVRGSWAVHVQGTLQLLRMRGTVQLSTDQGRQLLRLVHTPIMLKALMLGEEPPRESTQLVQAMQIERPAAPTFPSAVALFFFKVTMLRAQVKTAMRTDQKVSPLKIPNSQKRRRLVHLIVEGQTLEKVSEFESQYNGNSRWQLQSTNRSTGPAVCKSLQTNTSFPAYGLWLTGSRPGLPGYISTLQFWMRCSKYEVQQMTAR